jgi:S-adenosylmethionine:tRNA ribosyltransferase-isomerase
LFMTLKTSDFDYDLPQEYIAQTPIEPRDASRLMIINRQNEQTEHAHFRDLGCFLRPNDILVLNRTRVIPARLFGAKIPSGGKIELLLLRRQTDQVWEAMVGGKGLKPGKQIQLEGGLQAEIVADLGGPRRALRFSEALSPRLDQIGNVPLPPYIHAPLERAGRYQTVYAQEAGSAAAPTAGLHFTPQLIEQLKSQGIQLVYVTLHVGLDTFAPVREDDISMHKIHSEWCQLSPEAAATINAARHTKGRVIAVGTTSVRTLESAARQAVSKGHVSPFEGSTDLFILPGFEFKIVDAIITNFHLPRSTLIMMISAFSGRQRVLEAYEKAKLKGYRFYSFGDAMLML